MKKFKVEITETLQCESKIQKERGRAVKEFAEKLKKQITNTMYCRDGYIDYDDTMEVIDELLKEYVNEVD